MAELLYEELLGALRRRIRQAADGDTTQVFDAFAVDDARQLSEVAGEADPVASALLALFHWARHSAAGAPHHGTDVRAAVARASAVPPASRDALPPALRLLAAVDPEGRGTPAEWFGHVMLRTNTAVTPDVLDELVDVLRVVERLAEDALGAEAQAVLADLLFRRAENTGAGADLDAVIAMGDAASAALPNGHPLRFGVLANQGIARRARFQLTGDPADLEAAITSGLAAAAERPGSAVARSGLAITLLLRLRVTGDPADLTAAVEHGKAALPLYADGDPERSITLEHLARLLLTRARLAGSAEDLAEAVDSARAATEVPDAANQVAAREVLAAALYERFLRSAEPAHLLDLEQALRCRPAGTDDDVLLERLAIALAHRFDLTQDLRHLDESILIRRGLADRGTGSARSRHLLIAAVSLRLRAGLTGSLTDLAEGARCAVLSLAAPPPAERPELASLHGRLRDVARTGDPALLLDPWLPAEVARVVDLAESPMNLESLALGGWLLWMRAGQQADPPQEEVSHVVRMLHPVYRMVADAVPDAVAEAWAQDPGDAGVEEHGHHVDVGLQLLARYREGGRTDVLDDAVGHFRASFRTAPDDEARAVSYNNLALALAEGPDPDWAEVVEAGRRAVELSADEAHYRPGRLMLLCSGLRRAGRHTEDPGLLREAVRVGEQGVAVTPADHPSRGFYLATLYQAQAAEHQHAGEFSRLAEVVDRLPDAVRLLSPGRAHHVSALLIQAKALCALAEGTRTTGPLYAAERALGEALDSARGMARAAALSVLIRTLGLLYELTQQPEHLAAVVRSGRELVVCAAASDSAEYRTRHAGNCALLYAASGEAAVLDEGIALFREVRATSGDAVLGTPGLLTMAAMLRWKAEDSGDAAPAAEAERVCRQAVAGASENADLLAEHAEVLILLHRMTGHLPSLRSGIETGLRALAATGPGHSGREKRGHNVLDGLRSLYELTGEVEARDRGVALARAELQRHPAPDSSWRIALGALLALCPDGLEEAAELFGGFLAAATPDHTEWDRARSGLGLVRMRQYEQIGAKDFLLEATEAFQGEGGTASPGTLNSRATSLYLLSRRTADPALWDAAVEAGRELVAATPSGAVYRSLYLGNLSSFLFGQATAAGDHALLRESERVQRAAVVACGQDLAHRADSLVGLAQILLTADGDSRRLTEAVAAARTAVGLSSDEHPHRLAHLVVFGRALIQRAAVTGDRDALAEARDALAAAVVLPTAPTAGRVTAGIHWATTAMLLGDAREAETAYRQAVSLLVEQVGPGLAWDDRQHGIEGVELLPGDAAAAAIAAGHAEAAVALLEQGRGVLLTEALHSRPDLDTLRERAPRLAARFERVAGELRSLDLLVTGTPGRGATSAQVTQRRVDLGKEWRELCLQLRQVPGFESFLLPPPLSDVREVIRDGAVVMVNVSQWRCDALLVTGEGVDVVALPELSIAACVDQANVYLAALHDHEAAIHELLAARREARRTGGSAAHRRYDAAKDVLTAASRAVEEAVTHCLRWLWDTVAGPVAEYLGVRRGEERRVWWCPTGPLALLPLHAAGHPGDPERTLHERVISSYSPTLRALVGAHRPPATAPADARMLVVALPDVPGLPPLPNAARESDHLRELFPPSDITVLTGAAATCDDVVAALAGHRWVHFSCHGVQDTTAPAESCLLLADGPLTVGRLISERPSGEFAFLCACRTASGGPTLLNESITLASALHHAGYQHVVATLWPVFDAVAADLAAAVYGTLTETGSFQAAGSARALHTAMRALRARYPRQPSVWAPFVHIGV
ncbi:CHAT domain-containing protein [Streptomyces sp. NPDC021224]|uniref:CHAT domain-containing protein n=1 Tax=unclassified Streptomyces TaxID=2593676 RepID=UPI00379966A1